MEKSNTCFNPHLTGYGLEGRTGREFSIPYACFNPHLTGYGLEAVRTLVCADVSGEVSILILLDTGWKTTTTVMCHTRHSFNPHLTGYGLEDRFTDFRNIEDEVSILILLDTGWKGAIYTVYFQGCTVSILILLDTGWKKSLQQLPDSAAQSFNPHLTGYGLEDTVWKSAAQNLLKCFNPHLTGYGLEVKGVQRFGGSILVSILILLDTGWKL